MTITIFVTMLSTLIRNRIQPYVNDNQIRTSLFLSSFNLYLSHSLTSVLLWVQSMEPAGDYLFHYLNLSFLLLFLFLYLYLFFLPHLPLWRGVSRSDSSFIHFLRSSSASVSNQAGKLPFHYSRTWTPTHARTMWNHFTPSLFLQGDSRRLVKTVRMGKLVATAR